MTDIEDYYVIPVHLVGEGVEEEIAALLEQEPSMEEALSNIRKFIEEAAAEEAQNQNTKEDEKKLKKFFDEQRKEIDD